MDLRKKKFEDIFRRERPVGRRPPRASSATSAPIRWSATRSTSRGTKRLLECCATYGVKKLVVLSSSYVYGALPESPYYMDEDTALNVSRHYPDIRDLAEVDTLCNTFLWKYPDIATAILRPVPTLGYYVHNSIGGYLQAPLRADDHGLQPDGAVHPRGGPRRRRSAARSRPASAASST